MYVPVSCDLVDQIEIFATLKLPVKIVFANNIGNVEEEHIIKTWVTVNKEEFLITESGLKIRLDYLISINGKIFDQRCEKS